MKRYARLVSASYVLVFGTASAAAPTVQSTCAGDPVKAHQMIEELLFEAACAGAGQIGECAKLRGYPPSNLPGSVVALAAASLVGSRLTQKAAALGTTSYEGQLPRQVLTSPAGAYDTHEHFQTPTGEYTPDRIKLQDRIIARDLLRKGSSSAAPKVLYLAGPGGAGKSSSIKALERAGALNRDDYLVLDPDEIKKLIPEYNEFIKAGVEPSKVADLVHEESSIIHRRAIREALKANKNIIVDSTLKNTKFYGALMQDIRVSYPQYRSAIISVTANVDTIVSRVQQRYRDSGQYVSEVIVRDTAARIPASIEALAPNVDSVLRINTEHGTILESITADGQIRALGVSLDDLRNTTTANVVRDNLAVVGPRSTRPGIAAAGDGLRALVASLTSNPSAAASLSKVIGLRLLGEASAGIGIVYPSDPTACAENVDLYVDHRGSDCHDRIQSITPKFLAFLQQPFEEQMLLLGRIPELCVHLQKTYDRFRIPLFRGVTCQSQGLVIETANKRFRSELGADGSFKFSGRSFIKAGMFEMNEAIIDAKGNLTRVCGGVPRVPLARDEKCGISYDVASARDGAYQLKVHRDSATRTSAVSGRNLMGSAEETTLNLRNMYAQITEMHACCSRSPSRPTESRCREFGIGAATSDTALPSATGTGK